MSERKAQDKRKVLMYVVAAIVILAVVWVVLRGMNVFRYAQDYDNAIEAQQEQAE